MTNLFKKNKSNTFFLVLFCFFAGSAQAAELRCPKTIAAIENDSLNSAAGKILKSLYTELGCSVEFVELPARRGIKHFNSAIVDGELFRLRQVESHYDRPFIRSEWPLFVLSNSLWVHPELKDSERFPIGYFLGVVWQENYMKNIEGKSFVDSKKIFETYNKGHLRGFLAADFSVAAMVKNNQLSPPPEREKVLLEAPLYHYLASEFAPIMKRLSDKLKTLPFKNVGDNVEN
ncbi:MAG: hypothetical protein ISR45_05650 [Rhodospirillales bacterium]|nr:hypothetical protein [Rhodospirillales bacterium]